MVGCRHGDGAFIWKRAESQERLFYNFGLEKNAILLCSLKEGPTILKRATGY